VSQSQRIGSFHPVVEIVDITVYISLSNVYVTNLLLF
jgi:hypothetical protein